MSTIQLKNIKKSFGDETVIQDLNLTIEDGSFTVLVGPSGCGKTTTLRMIAGLEQPDSGSILIDGTDVVPVDPGKRGIAMVFQNYALYPTMTVRENIEFGLKNIGMQKTRRNDLIQDVCGIVGLTPFLSRRPSQLSGGQRQRVALARAIVKQPKVFLMDEPLSNLDAKLRAQMRIELIQLHKRLGTTFIYVTHDQLEAMSMADRIVLMKDGAIMQQSCPREIYNNPQNAYTAQFIGTPPMNILDTMVNGVLLGFRPERASLTPVQNPLITIPGTVTTREQLGAEMNYSVRTDYGEVMVKTEDDIEGNQCRLYVPEHDVFAFSSIDGSRIPLDHGICSALSELQRDVVYEY